MKLSLVSYLIQVYSIILFLSLLSAFFCLAFFLLSYRAFSSSLIVPLFQVFFPIIFLMRGPNSGQSHPTSREQGSFWISMPVTCGSVLRLLYSCLYPVIGLCIPMQAHQSPSVLYASFLLRNQLSCYRCIFTFQIYQSFHLLPSYSGCH